MYAYLWSIRSFNVINWLHGCYQSHVSVFRPGMVLVVAAVTRPGAYLFIDLVSWYYYGADGTEL